MAAAWLPFFSLVEFLKQRPELCRHVVLDAECRLRPQDARILHPHHLTENFVRQPFAFFLAGHAFKP
ncbi:MAG: hypothetical protein AB7I52_17205, partial [Rhizobiaceae bacterium]